MRRSGRPKRPELRSWRRCAPRSRRSTKKPGPREKPRLRRLLMHEQSRPPREHAQRIKVERAMQVADERARREAEKARKASVLLARATERLQGHQIPAENQRRPSPLSTDPPSSGEFFEANTPQLQLPRLSIHRTCYPPACGSPRILQLTSNFRGLLPM